MHAEGTIYDSPVSFQDIRLGKTPCQFRVTPSMLLNEHDRVTCTRKLLFAAGKHPLGNVSISFDAFGTGKTDRKRRGGLAA